MNEKQLRVLRLSLIFFTIGNILLFSAYIVIGFTVFSGGSSCQKNLDLFGNGYGKIVTHSQKLVYNFESKQLSLFDEKGFKILSAAVAGRIDFFENYNQLIVSRPDYESLPDDYVFKFKAISKSIRNLEFSIRNSNRDQNRNNQAIECDTIEWKVVIENESKDNTSAFFQEFEECFDLGNAYWYGQSESRQQQYWPINDMEWNDYKVFDFLVSLIVLLINRN